VPFYEVGTYGNSDNEALLVKFVERKYRYLIEVRNMKEKTIKANLIFEQIENIRVHGHPLENSSIYFTLEGK
jgi:hypothetical protein